ncbi:MAG: stage II sporulation protein D [Clostridia bacterium]
MKIYHKIEEINNINQLVLYVDYPDEYEFGLDFDSIKKNINSVADTIRSYAMKNIGNIKDNTVLLVLNGVVVGTILITQLTSPKLETIVQNPTSQIESSISDTLNDKNSEDANLKNIENLTNKNLSKSAPTNQNSTDIVPPPTNSDKIKPSPSPVPPVQKEKMINLKLNNGKIISIRLEDYIIGVVGAEMPASFNIEALKAQAVAARTYALKKSSSGITLTASTSDQVYKTNNELKSQWGKLYDTYYNKVKNAVDTTNSEYITYAGNYIDALYFSCSNGKTEDSINVWGNSFSYLKSVDSSFDKNATNYLKNQSIPKSTISSKFGVDLKSISQISIKGKTIGDRVRIVTICGKDFTGVQVRTKLGLRSADFDISEDTNNIIFTTRGYGHGVGMSQYGANSMAASGKNYKEILKHYYTGIQIKK